MKMEDTNLKEQRVYRRVWREEREGREYIIMLQSQNKIKIPVIKITTNI